jgi:hypothetical protein
VHSSKERFLNGVRGKKDSYVDDDDDNTNNKDSLFRYLKCEFFLNMCNYLMCLWEDIIKQDICQLKIQNWIACVQVRGKWKEVAEKAETFNQKKFSTWKKNNNKKKKKKRRRRRNTVFASYTF